MDAVDRLAQAAMTKIADAYHEYLIDESLNDNAMTRVGFYMVAASQLIEDPISDPLVQRKVRARIRDIIDSALNEPMPKIFNFRTL